MAVTETLQKLRLTSNNCSSSVTDFFSKTSCYGDKKSKHCKNEFIGDTGAFNCLRNSGDVAFMNMETYKNMTGKIKFHPLFNV